MPWEVKPNGNKFCVYKKGSSSPISGGCHKTRDDAVKQLRALYANEKQMSELQDTFIFDVGRTFAEADLQADKAVWIEALPAKTWHTMQYGEVAITPEKLQRFAENFKKGVRGQEIATDYEHGQDPAKGNKASGWYRDFDVRFNGDGTASLWASVEFTESAQEEIKNKEWKYFSLDYLDNYFHPETNELIEDVVVGGALTNRPVAKGMVPINLSEVFIADGKALSEFMDEVADLEHSEPGTGSPPQPREQEGTESDISTGSRRDTPPIETEDNAMNEEQLKALKELFAVDGDADADAIVAKAKEIVGENTQLSEQVTVLKAENEKLTKPEDQQRKQFAEQYPDEARRMAELEAVNRESGAKQFSESVQRFSKTSGDKTEPTNMGLSGLALQQVAEAHKKFSEGSGTVADFEDTMRAIVTNGIVEYGERGSSVQGDIPDVDTTGTPTGIATNRKVFAELVKSKQDKALADGRELTFKEAVVEVTRENPELAKEYRQSASA